MLAVADGHAYTFRTAKETATVTVDAGSEHYAIRLGVRYPNKVQRIHEFKFDDGPLISNPNCVRLASGSGQVLQLDLSLPNWNSAVFLVTGASTISPLVFKFRDNPKSVIKQIWTKDKGLTGIMTYDRWIGGQTRVVMAKGIRLDRNEEVRTYRIDRRGISLQRKSLRVIPNSGGGVMEKTYREL